MSSNATSQSRNARAQHVVNVSGGKDSAACYLLALERGMTFRAVTADTGHEHPETYEWIARLHERTGGPEVEVVQADFSKDIAKKRAFIAGKWPADGVSKADVSRALELLHPTGNPFLDLCLWKGRFPSSQVRFCTEFLKARPIHEQVIDPVLATRPVVQWQGERREESKWRAALPMITRVKSLNGTRDRVIWRPILEWTAEQTFELHRKHGLGPNPLYRQGMSRVGCMPCIMCRKSELREIAHRFPSEIERVAEWERLVAAVSKRGKATMFAADKTPQGAHFAKSHAADTIYPNIHEVVEWSKTSRGGRQYNMMTIFDEGTDCSSQYGLCE